MAAASFEMTMLQWQVLCCSGSGLNHLELGIKISKEFLIHFQSLTKYFGFFSFKLEVAFPWQPSCCETHSLQNKTIVLDG